VPARSRAARSLPTRDLGAVGGGADEEAGQGEQRCAEREAGGAHDREAGEHHVPRHVRDEDPAERQDRD
jgi:hypothetical protein